MSSPKPDEALRFYGAVFDWTGQDDTGYSICHLRDQPVAAVAKQGGSSPPAWLMYVSTSDVDATAREVEAAGGRVLLGPVDLADAGRTALFADPCGAVFSTWQRGSFGGARLFNEPGALCWFELASPDPATARRFYGEVFGWTARPDESMPGAYEWINGEDSVAGLVRGSGGWTVCVMVDDCAKAASVAEESGGKVLGDPIDSAVCRHQRLRDPYGATFTVTQLAPEVRRALHQP